MDSNLIISTYWKSAGTRYYLNLGARDTGITEGSVRLLENFYYGPPVVAFYTGKDFERTSIFFQASPFKLLGGNGSFPDKVIDRLEDFCTKNIAEIQKCWDIPPTFDYRNLVHAGAFNLKEFTLYPEDTGLPFSTFYTPQVASHSPRVKVWRDSYSDKAVSIYISKGEFKEDGHVKMTKREKEDLYLYLQHNWPNIKKFWYDKEMKRETFEDNQKTLGEIKKEIAEKDKL